MFNFIGLLSYMGIVRLPRIQHYWSTAPPLHGTWARAMISTRTRFQALLSFLRVVDHTLEDRSDKLHKVRYLCDHICTTSCQLFQPSRNIAIDERMVKTKARFSYKQCIRNKPVKFGVKVFALCDSDSSYLCNFKIYTGRAEAGQADVGLARDSGLDSGNDDAVIPDVMIISSDEEEDEELQQGPVHPQLLGYDEVVVISRERVEGGWVNVVTITTKTYRYNNGEEWTSVHVFTNVENNLYGWAMSQHLPTSKFQWCAPSDELLQKILTQPDDADTGYMVECDLSVPTEFHDRLNDYPPAPERVTITESMMSPYQRDLIAADPVSGLSAPKLVPNLMPKQRYVAHYRNLRLYSRLGLRIDAVHRVLSFRQAPWMKPYIQLNTELRKKAKNDFEKDFFKLMNNAVFGKTMENVRRRISIRLLRVEDEEDTILTAVAKSTYVRHVLFDNGLVGVENRKLAVHLNKPVYVGMSILELSKELMYRFYYDELQPRYGDRMSLLYTDTDSLVLLFRTEDLYADMKSMADQYDTSNFSPDSPLYSESNKKVVGKFKDELGGKLMTEFVALRSKMYAYDGEESGQRAKGVKRAVTRRFTIADYRQCLVDRTRMSHAMTTLRSHSHRIFTETMTKSSLSPFDSKRYIRADGVSTLAHGHHRIALLDD
eukprot:scpid78025/ scgid4574/ PiggyBac transposable element-derived protein 4